MDREIKLNELDAVLGELSYPAERDEAAKDCTDVTLRLADGEINLGELIDETESDEFDSVEDLTAELHNVLPREAVGEPYQSEGEG